MTFPNRWNCAFKSHIDNMRQQIKDKKVININHWSIYICLKLTIICFIPTEQQKTWTAGIAPTVSWDCQWILYSGKNMTEKYRISFNWHTTCYNLDVQPIINFCLLALEWVMFEVFTGSAWLHQSCIHWNFAWYGFVVWLVHYHVKLVEIVSSFSNFNRYKQQQENQ